MTREVAEKIIRGITDKIECNTADMDDWAEFWGFTREDYEEFLDLAIKALEQEPKTGHWIEVTNGRGGHECNICHEYAPSYRSGDEYLTQYCPNCGCRMIESQESEVKE